MSESSLLYIPENSHIVTTFEITDNDFYHATKIRFMSGKEATLSTRYPFRSQGNIHIVMSNEHDDFYRIVSFDGHKGDIYVNENKTITKLEEEINKLGWLHSMDEEATADDVETAICYTLKFKI